MTGLISADPAGQFIKFKSKAHEDPVVYHANSITAYYTQAWYETKSSLINGVSYSYLYRVLVKGVYSLYTDEINYFIQQGQADLRPIPLPRYGPSNMQSRRLTQTYFQTLMNECPGLQFVLNSINTGLSEEQVTEIYYLYNQCKGSEAKIFYKINQTKLGLSLEPLLVGGKNTISSFPEQEFSPDFRLIVFIMN